MADRSIQCTIVNNSRYPLVPLGNMSVEGAIDDGLRNAIPPNTIGVGNLWSVTDLHGCELWSSYYLGNDINVNPYVELHLDDPFVGTNKCSFVPQVGADKYVSIDPSGEVNPKGNNTSITFTVSNVF